MIPLPAFTTPSTPLHGIMNGAIHAKLLQAGLETGIFDALDTFRSAEEIAGAMGTHEQSTMFFLDALVTIGLLTKKEGRYHNTDASQEYLSTDSPLFLGPLFKMVRGMSIDVLDNMGELIRSGPRSQKAGEDPSAQSTWEDGARAGASWALGEMGIRVADIASGLPGFKDFDKMLDLGGGHGLFAMYMVQASKTLKAIVFDRPAVVDVAKEFIDTYEMSDRVDTMSGDYMEDDIGQDYDLVWASAALSFAKHDLDRLVRKIHFALKPQGCFISLHDGMTHERTQPDTNLGWLAGLLSTGVDYRFDQGEIAESMLRCGFRRVRSRTIATPMGDLDLDIGRKE